MRLYGGNSFNFSDAIKSRSGINNFYINQSESGKYVTVVGTSAFNFPKKRIKYIYFTVTAYNAVDGRVAVKTVKGIGPIELV